MKTIRIILLVLIIIGIILICTQKLWVNKLVNLMLRSEQSTSLISTPQKVTTTPTPPADSYGMSQYVDSKYGFSFWYPNDLKVSSTVTNDNTSFPGGVAVETLLVGEMGNTSVTVVNSRTSSIIDEPNNHASPIAQTEYSYDATSKQWMVSYPEGSSTGQYGPTVADTSKTTISGLFMLPSGKRFDTTIIPLSTTQFLVVSDGGGSSFTSELAQTISQKDAAIDPEVEATALQTEAAAYITQ